MHTRFPIEFCLTCASLFEKGTHATKLEQFQSGLVNGNILVDDPASNFITGRSRAPERDAVEHTV